MIIFIKMRRDQLRPKMRHAIVYVREFCLWDRYWGRTNQLWEHYFFFLLVAFLESICKSSLVPVSSLFIKRRIHSISTPALKIGLKDSKPTGDTLFLKAKDNVTFKKRVLLISNKSNFKLTSS